MEGLNRIEDKLENLQTDVSGTREDVATIKEQNKGQAKSISDISQKVDKLQRYFWIAVGILSATVILARIFLPDIDVIVTVPTKE